MLPLRSSHPYSTQRKKAKKEENGLHLHRQVLQITQPSSLLSLVLNWIMATPAYKRIWEMWSLFWVACVWLPLGKSGTGRKEWHCETHRILCYQPNNCTVVRISWCSAQRAGQRTRSQKGWDCYHLSFPSFPTPPPTAGHLLLGCQEGSAAARQ